jgi:hypothetical protein
MISKQRALLILLAALTANACAEQSPPSPPQATKIGTVYPDPRLTEFQKQVLTSMNYSFTIEKLPGGAGVFWSPRSKEDEMEVQQRVSQYAIHLQTCGEEGAPKPEQPSQPLGVLVPHPCPNKGT